MAQILENVDLRHKAKLLLVRLTCYEFDGHRGRPMQDAFVHLRKHMSTSIKAASSQTSSSQEKSRLIAAFVSTTSLAFARSAECSKVQQILAGLATFTCCR